MNFKKGDNDRFIYEIKIEGQFPDSWKNWFSDLDLIETDSGCSTIRGPLADQSELHGLLNKLRDMNLKLISVTRMGPSSVPP